MGQKIVAPSFMKAGSSSAREEGLDESRPYNFISRL
jgi:hypothetical protein